MDDAVRRADDATVTTGAGTRPEPAGLVAALLAWYDRHRRHLPWRAVPGTPADPYRVWLSEIMLQQTTVAAVAPYFERFVQAWPTVHDLAAADLDDVLKAWAGLGYYARARNLHACALEVARRHGGRFPDTVAELERLPGIGRYTAAAIAAIAFDRPVVPVDANVERVLARVHAVEVPLRQSKATLDSLVDRLAPQRRAGDFAQALMDLGATVCTARRVDCLVCPLNGLCLARARGIAERLPVRPPKPARPLRRAVAYWVEREDGRILVRRRPERGLLGGMTEIPSGEWREDGGAEAPPLAADWRPLAGIVRHTFTHFHLELSVHAATVSRRAAEAVTGDDWRWVRRERLAEEALPTVMRKVVAHAERARAAGDGGG